MIENPLRHFYSSHQVEKMIAGTVFRIMPDKVHMKMFRGSVPYGQVFINHTDSLIRHQQVHIRPVCFTANGAGYVYRKSDIDTLLALEGL